MIIDEHFRQFTREYKQNKHNRTFIVGNRIICREDHRQISEKEYKKDVSRFAPIKTNWCQIFDDTPEVWSNRDDIHRVPKYLFWPNIETDNAKNDNNKINIWSKNSVTLWNDDRSLKKQEDDNILIQAIELAKATHSCYYAKYTPTNLQISAPQIFAAIRRQIMKSVRIVFTGVFPTKNGQNDFHWKLAQLFGAHVSEQIDAQTTHVIGKESTTSKIQQAIKQNIQIVHVNWLYQTFFNFGIADCAKFRMPALTMNGVGDDETTTKAPPMHCKVKVKMQRELELMYQSK